MPDKDKLSVLFVVNAIRPHSGAEIVLADFLRANREADVHVLLIGRDRPSVATFQGVLPQDHIHFVYSDRFRDNKLTRWVGMPLEVYRQERYLRQHGQIDALVHGHAFDLVVLNNSLEAALFYRLFPGYPLMTYIHDMVGSLPPATRYSILQACERIPHIVTVSNACKQALVNHGVAAERIKVIYNGLTGAQVPFSSPETREVAIGFIGTVTRRKGFDLCVEIVNRLAAQKPARAVRLLVITKSDEDRYGRACLARLSRAVALDVYRNVPRSAVMQLYRGMNIALVTSRHDPLPTVVIEAISQGVPVIGSDVDGIPEMIADRRMVFPAGDVEEALQCITGWLGLSIGQQAEIVANNQRYVAENFSNEVKASALNRLMCEACERE